MNARIARLLALAATLLVLGGLVGLRQGRGGRRRPVRLGRRQDRARRHRRHDHARPAHRPQRRVRPARDGVHAVAGDVLEEAAGGDLRPQGQARQQGRRLRRPEGRLAVPRHRARRRGAQPGRRLADHRGAAADASSRTRCSRSRAAWPPALPGRRGGRDHRRDLRHRGHQRHRVDDGEQGPQGGRHDRRPLLRGRLRRGRPDRRQVRRREARPRRSSSRRSRRPTRTCPAPPPSSSARASRRSGSRPRPASSPRSRASPSRSASSADRDQRPGVRAAAARHARWATTLDKNVTVFNSGAPTRRTTRRSRRSPTAYEKAYPKGVPQQAVIDRLEPGPDHEGRPRKACENKDLSREGIVKAFRELKGIDTGGLVAGDARLHAGRAGLLEGRVRARRGQGHAGRPEDRRRRPQLRDRGELRAQGGVALPPSSLLRGTARPGPSRAGPGELLPRETDHVNWHLVDDDHPLTLQLVLARMRSMYGDAEVVTQLEQGRRRTSYAELGERVDRLARRPAASSAWSAATASRRSASNTQEHLELYLAVPCLGAVLHTVNIRLFEDDLEYIFNHAGDQRAVRRRVAGRADRAAAPTALRRSRRRGVDR